MEDLPQWLSHLTALHQLDLVGNRLRALPLELAKKLTNLTTLALSEYVLLLSPSALRVPYMMVLCRNAKFTRNAFSFSLPPLATLVRLSDVSLGALNFSAFPLPLLDLPALRTLNLSDNRITSIPDEISRLSTLQALFLNLNPISALPAGTFTGGG